MGSMMKLQSSYHRDFTVPTTPSSPLLSQYRYGSSISIRSNVNRIGYSKNVTGLKRRVRESTIVASSSAPPSFLDSWRPDKSSSSPSLSDIIWPSAGAFAAMAVLGRVDQMLVTKGVAISVAPLGAVCAILFTAPSSPAAKKYNMFMAQIGCAAISVLAFSTFGPGWLAKSVGLSACIAFMIYTRSIHPPAASLPLLFIDAAKLHHLNYWYCLFPGAAACILLCFIQEMVSYMKNNLKF